MSSTSRLSWRLLTILLALNATFGGLLALELNRTDDDFLISEPRPTAAVAPSPAAVEGKKPAAHPGLAPIEAYITIVERPLFIPGRRPIMAETVAPAAPGSLPALRGMIMSDERTAAVFQLPDTAQYVLGAKGEMVGGWRIEDITPDRVVLSNNAARRVLQLEDLAAPRRGAAPGGSGGKRETAEGNSGDGIALRPETGSTAADGASQ